MSRVEKHNPLKSGTLSRKRDGMKGDTASKSCAFSELTFDSVRDDAVRFGLVSDVLYQMNAGKEASIFLAEWKKHPIILKAYRLWQSSHKLSKKSGYIAGGTSKRTYSILGLVEDLAVKEYDILSDCFKAGVPVPTPIGRVGNYVTMRFIGDGTEPAPQLKDVTLENPEEVLCRILDDYLIMYRDAHYVHGDLSKYNILWWQNRPWIIDVPQALAVGNWTNMTKAEAMLLRDIKNVLTHFESYDIYWDANHILETFLEEYIPKNLRNYRELRKEGVELL